eukprot:jgi/Mesvir1/27808/Mv07489-RA.1
MSKRPSTQRSLTAALGNENTSAAPAAASPSGPAGSGDTSRALVAAQHPPGLPASPSASPDPKRSRSSFPREPRFKYNSFHANDHDWFNNISPVAAMHCIFFGDYASLLELCLYFHSIHRLLEFDGTDFKQSRELLLTGLYPRPELQHMILCSLLTKSDGEILAPTISAATYRSILTEAFQQHVTPLAADPSFNGRRLTSARTQAELAKRSLNVIVKNLKMEEGENSEELARAFEREILDRMGLTGEIELAAHRLSRARGKAGAPPLLLTFKTPADKISFLRRRKRLEKTLFTLDDDLTLAQQQRRRELWPTYLQLRQTKAGQPVYWKGAAIYVGHKPGWQATPAAPVTPDAPA